MRSKFLGSPKKVNLPPPQHTIAHSFMHTASWHFFCHCTPNDTFLDTSNTKEGDGKLGCLCGKSELSFSRRNQQNLAKLSHVVELLLNVCARQDQCYGA